MSTTTLPKPPGPHAAAPVPLPATGLLDRFYALLMLLAALSMVMTLVTILLGIAARWAVWDVPGLDAYAGYSIAATLFLALAGTLKKGDHIRVTLVQNLLPAAGRRALELWSLCAGLGLSVFMAYFTCRLAMGSFITHDISTGTDATPLWMPQSLAALGAIGFAVAMADGLIAHFQGRTFFEVSEEAARVE